MRLMGREDSCSNSHCRGKDQFLQTIGFCMSGMKPCVRTTRRRKMLFSEFPPNKSTKRRKIRFVRFRSVAGNEKTQNPLNRKITEKFRGVSRANRFCGKKKLKSANFQPVSAFSASMCGRSCGKNASILACFPLFCSVSVAFLSGKREQNFEAFRGVSRHFEAFRGHPETTQTLKISSFFRVFRFRPKIEHAPPPNSRPFVNICLSSEHFCFASTQNNGKVRSSLGTTLN